MKHNNQPISYDFHGDIPFQVPFTNIPKNDIHLYIDVDTNIGPKTCGQACTHCWFLNYEKVRSKSFAGDEGKAIVDDLRSRGYTVYPRYTDSFAYKGMFMKAFGPAHNREFRYDDDHKQTETMFQGDAWTSGKPLMGDDYVELLDLARISGYGTISITYHGVLNEDLSVQPSRDYPIKGVFKGQDFEILVERINRYNSMVDENEAPQFVARGGFRINVGLTLGRHNYTRESLIRYVEYFNAMPGVGTLRFNRFHDHGGRHPDLTLTNDEVVEVYKDLKWIHDNLKLNFQMGVSEDFGTYGVKVMGFPGHVGWCRAGRQLFTIIPCDELLLESKESLTIQKIGEVTACVNIFEPYLGALVRVVDNVSGEVRYDVQFDADRIEIFTGKRMDGTYKNGCFADEMSKELKHAATEKQNLIAVAEA
ncbi:radical SAM protein [Teredinibacter turnerae]|uniref:radical SAM protein n=1 Tax=Teredinibacter turnerae TaxID=2426 RepID=UPI00037AED69|nr:radical SAM protein [Teredinibacter turnerae]